MLVLRTCPKLPPTTYHLYLTANEDQNGDRLVVLLEQHRADTFPAAASDPELQLPLLAFHVPIAAAPAVALAALVLRPAIGTGSSRS